MIDILELPVELRESIWTEYRNGVRKRLAMQRFTRALGQDGASTVLDWMAHMLQYPLANPGKAIVLEKAGSFTTTFVELLSLLLGRDQVVERTTLRHLSDEHLDGTTLIHLAVANLSEELPRLNRLVTLRTTPPTHRVLITTNALSPLLRHSIPFHLHYTVITCGTTSVPEFRDAIRDPAHVAALREHLMHRPVPPVM